ncbi:MAG: PEGA domain-containing protein, partial [Myxococcales bacterium]|nr:PEGA domain-containing protein [Myxococcales bacterium]
KAALSRKPGFLYLITVPYSVVFLRGRRLGTTPIARVSLPPGTHTLTLRNPQLGAFALRVTIRPGQKTKLRHRLKR